jgi:hypothetical protein
LAVAFFVPHLRALLGGSRSGPEYDQRTGRNMTYSILGDLFIGAITRGAARLGYALIAPLWVPLRERVVQPLLSRVLLDVVKATAFGLPPVELSGASIDISDRLQLPTWFADTHVDAADALLHAPPTAPAAVPAEQIAAHYEFLHVDQQLEEKKPESALWKTVSAAMPDVQKFYRDRDPARLEHDLLLHSVLLEERLKEVAGSVPLTHSRYYSNQQIIETIAGFIAGHALPENASPPGAA